MKFTVTAGAFANALALATLLGDDRRVKKNQALEAVHLTLDGASVKISANVLDHAVVKPGAHVLDEILVRNALQFDDRDAGNVLEPVGDQAAIIEPSESMPWYGGTVTVRAPGFPPSLIRRSTTSLDVSRS